MFRYIVCNNDREWREAEAYLVSQGARWASGSTSFHPYGYERGSETYYPLGMAVDIDNEITFSGLEWYEREDRASLHPYKFKRNPLDEISVEGAIL